MQLECKEKARRGQCWGKQRAIKWKGNSKEEGMKMARRGVERVRRRQGEGKECPEGKEKAKR
jgi:hypothetical protein